MKAATTVLAFLAATPSVFSAVISTANSTADIYQLFARGNPEYTCKPIEKKEDYCKGITEQFCSDNVKCEDTMVNGCPRPMTWIKSFNECSPMAMDMACGCKPNEKTKCWRDPVEIKALNDARKAYDEAIKAWRAAVKGGDKSAKTPVAPKDKYDCPNPVKSDKPMPNGLLSVAPQKSN